MQPIYIRLQSDVNNWQDLYQQTLGFFSMEGQDLIRQAPPYRKASFRILSEKTYFMLDIKRKLHSGGNRDWKAGSISLFRPAQFQRK